MKLFPVVAALATTMLVPVAANAEPFSGPFVGVDVGYDNAKINNSYSWYNSDDYFYEDDENGRAIDGISGGIFAGYDAKLSNKVFAGVEVRAALSDATYDRHSHFVDGDRDVHHDLAVKLKESFSATARLGYLINENTGVYLRGGAVQSRFTAYNEPGFPVDFDPDTSEYSELSSAADKNIGFVYGAGIESAIGKALSLRVEYNVSDFGTGFNKLNKQLADAETSDYGDDTYFGTKLGNHQVRVGLAYRY